MIKDMNELLDGIGKTESISYVEQMIILMADYQSSRVGPNHDIVQHLLRSARAVGHMRGMDAREAYLKWRDKQPWWRRPFITKEAPDAFIKDYIQREQQKAKDKFVQGLKDIHEAV